jgi:hypothetical protein
MISISLVNRTLVASSRKQVTDIIRISFATVAIVEPEAAPSAMERPRQVTRAAGDQDLIGRGAMDSHTDPGPGAAPDQKESIGESKTSTSKDDLRDSRGGARRGLSQYWRKTGRRGGSHRRDRHGWCVPVRQDGQDSSEGRRGIAINSQRGSGASPDLQETAVGRYCAGCAVRRTDLHDGGLLRAQCSHDIPPNTRPVGEERKVCCPGSCGEPDLALSQTAGTEPVKEQKRSTANLQRSKRRRSKPGRSGRPGVHTNSSRSGSAAKD